MRPYDVREYWTRVAENIARRPGENVVAGLETPFYMYKRRRFVSTFLQALPVEGRSVLEVGCGPGGNLVELAKLGPDRLVGCDISPVMLEIAGRTTADLVRVELVPTDGRTLPFSDREFDVVFTATVLQHNHDSQMRQVAADIARVASETIHLFEDTAVKRRERYSVVMRPVAEYAAVFAEHGFRMTEARPLGVFVSERSAAVTRRLLHRREPTAGEPIAGLAQGFERGALAVTRRLDPHVRQRQGLTRIVLTRR